MTDSTDPRETTDLKELPTTSVLTMTLRRLLTPSPSEVRPTAPMTVPLVVAILGTLPDLLNGLHALRDGPPLPSRT